MGLAGLVNAAMLVVAAALFHGSPIPDTDTLEGVYAGLARALDAPAATLFALALLASGFASSGVGTYAGQVVMQGFVQRRIPLFARRALTLTPAIVVLSLGVDPTAALVFSQVVLAFGIPFALVPLVLLTRRPRADGRAGEPHPDDGGGRGGRGRDHRPERRTPLAHVHLERAIPPR